MLCGLVDDLNGATRFAGLPLSAIAGNVDTALATIAAAEGVPLHRAHLQFYAYGRDGDHGFSSEAARLAEAVSKADKVTVDVGQVMFGPTSRSMPTFDPGIGFAKSSRQNLAALWRLPDFTVTGCRCSWAYRESGFSRARSMAPRRR